jgi:hypothetical protein
VVPPRKGWYLSVRVCPFEVYAEAASQRYRVARYEPSGPIRKAAVQWCSGAPHGLMFTQHGRIQRIPSVIHARGWIPLSRRLSRGK